jgi:hypothetical protein
MATSQTGSGAAKRPAPQNKASRRITSVASSRNRARIAPLAQSSCRKGAT